jgi:hypothetical protein
MVSKSICLHHNVQYSGIWKFHHIRQWLDSTSWNG